tara:strand:+ start:267 stop:1343 length:1077 start_codon:yes stop_codon:yes gene_type:complete
MTKAAELAKMGEVLTNSQIGGRRNIFINGAMQVAQRGTSATDLGSTSGFYTVDRWETAMSGNAGRFTMSQVDSGLNGFGNAIKLDCTTADTDLGTTEFLLIQQKIEGQNVQQLKKGTSDAERVTVSFYAKVVGSATKIVLELNDGDNNRIVSKLFTLTTNWARYSYTFPADTTGVLDDDNATSLTLKMWLHAGSSYTTGTLGETWASRTNANRAVGIDSFFSSTDNEFFLTGIQLEVGSVVTPFEHRSFGEELLLCQRYFQLISGGAVMPNSSTGIEGSVTRQEMRAATSISVTAAMKVEDPSVTTYTQSSASATISNSDKFAEKFTLQNFSGLNTQRPYFLKNPQDGGGQIELDAEL